MKQSNFLQIKDHIEFMGYEITDFSVEDGLAVMEVDRADVPGLVVSGDDNSVLLIRKFRGFNVASLNKHDFFEKLNACNNSSLTTNWGYGVVDGKYLQINAKTCHFGYDKVAFARQLETFNEEVDANLASLMAFCEDGLYVVK